MYHNNKSVFFSVGGRVINRYEVREAQVGHTTNNRPIAKVTYKDGSTVKVTGSRVPGFIAWLLDQPIPVAHRDVMGSLF